MKIAITGHTQGIGLAITEYLIAKGHTCVGYCRSNGHDISTLAVQDKIVNDINDADIFINNAWHVTGQLELLEKVCKSWESKNKTIINISSFIGDYLEFNTDPMFQTYIESKRAIDIFCKEYIFKNDKPWIVNLKPEIVDTAFSNFLPDKKMSTSDVVSILDFVININPTVKISSISFKTNRN